MHSLMSAYRNIFTTFAGLRSSGFTLIELIVVVAIIGVMSGIGVTTALNYSRTQTVDSAANDFASVIQVAKSRSFSQSKPDICASAPLYEYQISVIDSTHYALLVRCGTQTHELTRKTLPTGVTISPTTGLLTFPVLKSIVVGGIDVVSGKTFTIAGYSITRTVTIYEDARIKVQ